MEYILTGLLIMATIAILAAGRPIDNNFGGY